MAACQDKKKILAIVVCGYIIKKKKAKSKRIKEMVVLQNYNYTGFDQEFYKGGASWLLNYEVKSKNAPILKRKETKV